MKCPNCEQEFDGNRCPNCGRPIKSGGDKSTAILIMVLVLIPSALFGTCCVAVSVSKADPEAAQIMAHYFGMIGVMALAFAFIMLGIVIKVWRG